MQRGSYRYIQFSPKAKQCWQFISIYSSYSANKSSKRKNIAYENAYVLVYD